MAKRKVNLHDELGWRLRMAHYALLFARIDMGYGEQGQILDDLSMLNLEMRQFVEQSDSDERDDRPDDGPSDEGPVGPLPRQILDEMGKEEV